MVLGRKAGGGADFLLFFSFHRFGGVILAPGQLFPTEPPLVGRLFPPPRSSSSSSSWRTSITLPPPPLVFVRGGCERQATAAEERRGGVSEDSVWESRVCECGPLPPSFLPPSSRVINRCHLPAIFLFLFFFLFRLFPLLNSHHVIIIGRGGGPPPTFSRENGECFGVCMPCVSPVLSLQSSPQCRFPLSRPPGRLLLIYDVYPPPPRSTIFFSLILPLSCTPPSSSLPLPFPPTANTGAIFTPNTLDRSRSRRRSSTDEFSSPPPPLSAPSSPPRHSLPSHTSTHDSAATIPLPAPSD